MTSFKFEEGIVFGIPECYRNTIIYCIDFVMMESYGIYNIEGHRKFIATHIHDKLINLYAILSTDNYEIKENDDELEQMIIGVSIGYCIRSLFKDTHLNDFLRVLKSYNNMIFDNSEILHHVIIMPSNNNKILNYINDSLTLSFSPYETIYLGMKK